MATSILVNRNSDAENLARLILRDLGRRRRTILKTLGVENTERAMEAVAEAVSKTIAAALRYGVPPERVRFHLLLRPRRVRHPQDGVPRDGYRLDLRLGNGEVETVLRAGTFRPAGEFPRSKEEDGVHWSAGEVSTPDWEEKVRTAVLAAWYAIKEANGDVITLRKAGILDPDRPLLAYELFLGPVVLGEERAVRLLMRRASLTPVVEEQADE